MGTHKGICGDDPFKQISYELKSKKNHLSHALDSVIFLYMFSLKYRFVFLRFRCQWNQQRQHSDSGETIQTPQLPFWYDIQLL